MGFIVYGEFLRAVRGDEEQWGVTSGQTVWIANYLGADDADVMLRVKATQPATEIDWRTGAPGAELSVQRSRHCWLYVADDTPFDETHIALETRLLRLPIGDRKVVQLIYRGQPMQLIYPRPSDYALEQAADPVRTPVESIDFLHYHPCWPVKRFELKNGEWVRSKVASPEVREPTEQPATIELRRRLTTMNAALLESGVVGGEVHGDPPGESWFEVADQINAKQLAALGKEEPGDVPIAWYRLSGFIEDEVEDVLRHATDPERLVEEWWDRLERWHHDEPPPGKSSTSVYFMGHGGMATADVGAAIVEAATVAGLHVDWNGDSQRAVNVRL